MSYLEARALDRTLQDRISRSTDLDREGHVNAIPRTRAPQAAPTDPGCAGRDCGRRRPIPSPLCQQWKEDGATSPARREAASLPLGCID